MLASLASFRFEDGRREEQHLSLAPGDGQCNNQLTGLHGDFRQAFTLPLEAIRTGPVVPEKYHALLAAYFTNTQGS